MKPAPFEFFSCLDAADALARLVASGGDAQLASGTQSLGPMLNLRLTQPTQLLDVSRIEALRKFSLDGDRLRIGAAVTHARIEDGELPDLFAGLLAHVAGGIAYRAVRNRGTLGGSLMHADPAADWVSVMSLLGAELILLGPGGERRVSAADFFEGPFSTARRADELLVAVELRRVSPTARWAYRKACRKPGEFAKAIAAVWVDPTQHVARVVLGALDSMPYRIDGAAALAALREPAGVARLLDAAGVHDDHNRAVHAGVLRRALADLDVFPARSA